MPSYNDLSIRVRRSIEPISVSDRSIGMGIMYERIAVSASPCYRMTALLVLIQTSLKNTKWATEAEEWPTP